MYSNKAKKINGMGMSQIYKITNLILKLLKKLIYTTMNILMTHTKLKILLIPLQYKQKELKIFLIHHKILNQIKYSTIYKTYITKIQVKIYIQLIDKMIKKYRIQLNK